MKTELLKISQTWECKQTWKQVQEAQKVPIKINQMKFTARHIVVKVAKIKDKGEILKAARKKQLVTYKGA